MGMSTTRRLNELGFCFLITGASVGASEHMGKIPRVLLHKSKQSTARMEILAKFLKERD
jgi:hypothetical protein